MRAWHRGSLRELVARSATSIAAELAAAAANRRLAPNPESLGSWVESTTYLQAAARNLVAHNPSAHDWTYFLEFEIPRRSRRIDGVVIAGDLVFLLEWKVGADRFDRSAIWQAEQYALDLRDFHEASHNCLIVPLLIATNASPRPIAGTLDPARLVQPTQLLRPEQLADAMSHWWKQARELDLPHIEAEAWERAAYRPTPTIIEAAGMLYEGHDVREISQAGARNLDETVDAVLELIDRCQRERRRGVAFITGAPGSGKTLAGLQVVHAPEVLGRAEAAGVFVSGNVPLVNVISASLVESAGRAGRSKAEAAREVRTFIQHAYAFRNEYASHPGRHPSEHVVLFDEAQRAWDARQVASWTKNPLSHSEPRIFLDVMSRVPDWAVIIALVGGGQEINRGEAGLGEWGRALAEAHPDWIVLAAPAVLPGSGEVPPGGRLLDALGTGMEVHAEPRLRLEMNVRSPRAERLNRWVDQLLDLDLAGARSHLPDQRDFPLVMTRDLSAAREWLRDRNAAEPKHRTGLLVSADAKRLRAWGLDTQTLQRERKWADWFLRDPGDVRGSDQLEVAATNFDCQGLEIDWAGIVWGNDLVPAPDRAWTARQFRGTKWQNANAERARYIVNAYRVLLTRARRGQVICVPQPDGRDATVPREEFDRIAEALGAAGVPSID